MVVVEGTFEVPGGVEMTPGVRTFLMGFVMGAVFCMGFIVYYGDRGGDWLIAMGHKMRTAAGTTDSYRPN